MDRKVKSLRLGKGQFAQWLEKEFLSKRTIETYANLFGLLERELTDPSPETIKSFLKKHPRKYYGSAVRYYCSFRWGTDVIIPKIKEKAREKQVCGNLDTIKAVVQNLKPKLGSQDRVILNLRIYTGRRIMEVLMLKVRDIDFSTKKIKFRLKGGECDETVISDHLIETLKRYIRENDFLGCDDLFYPCKKESKYQERSKYNRHIAALKKAGAPPELLKTHNIRRAVINTLILKKGIEHANAYVGHKKLDTTLHYCQEETRKILASEAAEVMVDETK